MKVVYSCSRHTSFNMRESTKVGSALPDVHCPIRIFCDIVSNAYFTTCPEEKCRINVGPMQCPPYRFGNNSHSKIPTISVHIIVFTPGVVTLRTTSRYSFPSRRSVAMAAMSRIDDADTLILQVCLRTNKLPSSFQFNFLERQIKTLFSHKPDVAKSRENRLY
jgi:hypothetical protein